LLKNQLLKRNNLKKLLQRKHQLNLSRKEKAELNNFD
jgi:hypothetical protein